MYRNLSVSSLFLVLVLIISCNDSNKEETVEEKQVEVLNFGSDFMIVDTLNLAKTSSVVIEGAAYLKSNDSIQILK